jgi:hypothetical protein
MAVITLLTDFGTHDPCAAIMKGVILNINPRVGIVDISHWINPQDVHHAARTLAHSYMYFPSKTVHIVVVDPGVGGSRAVVALQSQSHLFLAPDNGVLTPVVRNEPIEKIVRVENAKYFLTPVSRTFHGRDIFAPVGANLSLGLPIDRLGPAIGSDSLVRLKLAQPRLEKDGRLYGTVVDIDRFGNLITNIDWTVVEHHYPAAKRENFRLLFGRHCLTGLSSTYDSVDPGTPLVLIGSRGALEISVNQGNAALLFKAHRGMPISVLIDSTTDA